MRTSRRVTLDARVWTSGVRMMVVVTPRILATPVEKRVPTQPKNDYDSQQRNLLLDPGRIVENDS